MENDGEYKRVEQTEIINHLDLTEEEVNGVNKFLEAVDISVRDMKEVGDAINTKFYLPLDKNNPSRRQMESLYNTLQEFFSCFLVVGYDMEGNHCLYQYTPNELSLDALRKKFQDTYRQFMLEEAMNEEMGEYPDATED